MTTISIPREETARQDVRRARRGLIVYFAILIPLSVILEWLSIAHIVTNVALLMLTPAVSSLITRLILREGFADISLQLGGRRGLYALLFMTLLPIGIGLLTYVPAWLTHLTTYHALGLPLGSFVHVPVLDVGGNLLLMTILGGLGLLPFTAGEELGWRGFMLTRLVQARLPFPILLSGVIWSLWHSPEIIGGTYHSGTYPLLSVALFAINATTFSYIVGWTRLWTGSVWPAILGHAVWNIVIDTTFDSSTLHAGYWVGETGILTAGLSVIIAIVLYRYWPLREMRLTPQLTLAGDPITGQAAPTKIGSYLLGTALILGSLVYLIRGGYIFFVLSVLSGVAFFVYGNRLLAWSALSRRRRLMLGILIGGIILLLLTDIPVVVLKIAI